MKKTYYLKPIDCANCAAKIESKIQDLDEVKDARLSFMTQRLRLALTRELTMSELDQLTQQIQTIADQLSPGTQLI